MSAGPERIGDVLARMIEEACKGLPAAIRWRGETWRLVRALIPAYYGPDGVAMLAGLARHFLARGEADAIEMRGAAA